MYLMERGYVDLKRVLKLISKKNGLFVSRGKDKMVFEVV